MVQLKRHYGLTDLVYLVGFRSMLTPHVIARCPCLVVLTVLRKLVSVSCCLPFLLIVLILLWHQGQDHFLNNGIHFRMLGLLHLHYPVLDVARSGHYCSVGFSQSKVSVKSVIPRKRKQPASVVFDGDLEDPPLIRYCPHLTMFLNISAAAV